jgi:hypothetical protein
MKGIGTRGARLGRGLRLGPGALMDGRKQRRLILFEPAASSNLAPATMKTLPTPVSFWMAVFCCPDTASSRIAVSTNQ